MIAENVRVICPPVLIVEAVSWTSPAGAETACFALDLLFGDDDERGAADFAPPVLETGDFDGAFFGLDDVFAATALAAGGAFAALGAGLAAPALVLAGAFFALDDVLTAGVLALAAAFFALGGVLAAVALAFEAAGLAVPDLTGFAFAEADFSALPPCFADAGVCFRTDFAFGFTALATGADLDDLTFFAAISISSKFN